MAMLHPKFNHLGRSKKKATKPSKTLEHATKLHQAWLLRRGIKPAGKRSKLKGCIELENPALVRDPEIAPTSDKIDFFLIKTKKSFVVKDEDILEELNQ